MYHFKVKILLGLLVILSFATLAPAAEIIIMPDSVVLEPEHGRHFRAQLFDDQDKPVRIAADKYQWSVLPSTFGIMSADGYFIAGKQPGRGKIVAVTAFNGTRLVGEADVWIGREAPLPIKILVKPERVVVPPGDSVFFKISGIAANNRPPVISNIRWEIVPKELGMITPRGLFLAGRRIMEGLVIAQVEINNQWYRGEARIIVSPPPNAVLQGTVSLENGGAPIEKVTVRAHRLGPIRWFSLAQTNSQGEYTLRHLIPGKYVVQAEKPGLITEWYDNVREYQQATPLEVAHEDTLTGVDFALSTGAQITGITTLQDAKLPVPRVHVVAWLVVNPLIRYHAVSDENGKYGIEGLPSGAYTVLAEKEGYFPEWYQEKSQPGQADMVKVTEPNTTADINFTLATATAISGQVTQAGDGSPIAGAHVYARYWLNTMAREITAESRTDRQGNYILQVLRPGQYIVFAAADGFAGEIYKDAVRVEDAKPVKVEFNQHTPDINFDLAELGKMTGRVVNELTGAPINGAVVNAYLEVPRNSKVLTPAFRAQTDSLGNYRIEKLPAGKYLVEALARHFLPEFYKNASRLDQAIPVAVKDSTLTKGIDFDLITGGIISGLVASADDSVPLAKALVSVQMLRSSFTAHTYTLEDGTFKVAGLPSGEYLVWAKARGYLALYYHQAKNIKDATKVTVKAPDATGKIDFYLPPIVKAEGVIAGLVQTEIVDSTGVRPTTLAPVQGAWIVAVPVANALPAGLPYWTTTDEDGAYQLTHLRPGKYVVATWARGFIGEFYDNVRSWRKATAVPAEAAKVTENINFVLEALNGGAYLAAGHVTNTAGKPVDQALVYASNSNGVVSSAMTDADGYFVIDGLMPGDYQLEVSRVEYNDGYSPKMVSVGYGEALTTIEIQLSAATTGIEVGPNLQAIPTSFRVEQNYPNPFNPTTTIYYQLPTPARVSIQIYNLLGQSMRTLIDEIHPAGYHRIQWDGRDLNGNLAASGIYFYHLRATTAEGTEFQKILKMSLLK